MSGHYFFKYSLCSSLSGALSICIRSCEVVPQFTNAPLVFSSVLFPQSFILDNFCCCILKLFNFDFNLIFDSVESNTLQFSF